MEESGASAEAEPNAVVASLVVGSRSLEVRWADTTTSRYPWIWLRDHAHDEATMHPITQQRQLFTASLPAGLHGTSACVVGEALEVGWSDGSAPSVLPLAFLARFRVPHKPRVSTPRRLRLWDGGWIHANPPTVAYDAVMLTDAGVAHWLSTTSEFGFSLVVGTPADAGSTEALLRRAGYVRETIFGGMWEFTADLSKADTAYTNLELRPHTDGTYSHDAPGAQMLHCLSFDGTGGESILVDGFAVAERLQRQAPDHYATLSSVAIPGQYIGDGSHLLAERPVLRHDANGDLVQVSFNGYDRAPFLLPEPEMIAFYDAWRAFDLIANDPSMRWLHRLAPGEALLFDNWRVLHGREAYTGVRRMCGGYVNHEDLESRLRLLD